MADELNARTILSSLAPPPKVRNEKWARVESYLPEIFAARERGVPWPLIAQTLSVDGVEVSATNLRIFISKIKRKRNLQSAQPKIARLSRATIMHRSKTAKATTDEPPATVDTTPATTVSDSPPLPKEENQHAGIRRRNARL